LPTDALVSAVQGVVAVTLDVQASVIFVAIAPFEANQSLSTFSLLYNISVTCNLASHEVTSILQDSMDSGAFMAALSSATGMPITNMFPPIIQDITARFGSQPAGAESG
jgi:hypothetical protein